jgi:asparagine synthase (glutamine-hydrolysing)
VKRSFAGAFDPGLGLDPAELTGALAPEPARAFESPPLRVAFAGSAPAAAGDLFCLLDGHLDNAEQIRAELGEPRVPGAPEELLAHAYRRWGQGLAERMRGDFALLLWDAGQGRGLIVRDQLGLRPLFVCRRGKALLFATEIHRLLALLPSRPEPDPAGVAHWLLARNRPEMRTLFSGIRRLQPAGMLLLDKRGVRETRYWRPRFEDSLELAPEQVSARLREAIELAVDRQMAATGRTGVLMSGGLDSSSIAAVGAARAPRRVYAYAGTFPEHPAVDESELIAELRQALRLPGATARVLPGGLLASAIRHLSAWRMPLLGWSEFWTLPLARAARSDGVGTMLDGTGGDELFGPFSYLLADRLRAGRPGEVLALAYGLPGGGPHVPRRQVAGVIRTLALAGALPYRLHARAERLFARRQAPDWLLPGAAGQLRHAADPLAWKRLDGPRWWAYTAHGIAHEIEASGVAESQNRWAASAGLEVRMPLLDLDLVELALRQPPEATFDRRFSRPLLRASMAEALPDSVRLRPAKAWFDSLIVDCLSGADAAAVRAILTDPGAELGAFVDLNAMREELLDSDRARREDPLGWMSVVWRLVTAELWLRAHASGAAEIDPGAPPSRPLVQIEATDASYFFPP